ncbi:response regulator transcription factor [Blastomonas sp. SL216]|uniref:response regulator transcription factor n=1 Tax=Blastomonas sp. SL216 TaxID=2995169 RepID=UPI002377913F|nr:helix-turn-helix transcriptional regulator [Blastomonas sp. SL216]
MGDSVSQPLSDEARWARLTDRQRACLDLLLERQTSKQIARALNISKPTVDQRLTAARAVLGAANRDEAALIYARLKLTYDRILYDPVQVPPGSAKMAVTAQDDMPADAVVLSDSAVASEGSPFRMIWRHDHGLKTRMLIMTVMLLVAIILILAGLGIAEALTRLVSG